MMSELLVHIGLHRTGSTWFQQTALPDEGTPIVDAWPDRADLARKIIKPCNADFAENVLRMELDSRCEAVRSKGDIPVISHERFSGNPSSGAFDMNRTAERIQRLCPDAKILVILRDQQSQLESIWCQAVRIGLYCSANDYLRPHHPGDFRIPHFEPSYLLHDEIVGEYARRFGRERVLALDFELLQKDSIAYMNMICDFVGAEPITEISREVQYARPHPLEAAILRRGNLLHRRTSMNPGPPLESERMYALWKKMALFLSTHAPLRMRRRFQEGHEQVIREFIDANDTRIRRSNRRLRDELKVNLTSDKWRF